MGGQQRNAVHHLEAASLTWTEHDERTIADVITIEPAGSEDLDRLVELESCLFHEDAGRHDKFADVTWPQREGRDDFERLVASTSSLVLVARSGQSIVANSGAQRFYERQGFTPQSISRIMSL